MTCKQCVHHETFRDDAFYCESMNDILLEDDNYEAEDCQWFKPLHVEGNEADASTAEVRSTSFADKERSDA